MGAAVAAILLANNLRDRAEDRAAGIRTLAHVLGPRGARRLWEGLVLAATAIPVALAAAGGPVLLLAAPALLVLVLRPWRALRAGRRLPDVDARVARFATLLAVLLAAAYLLAGLRVAY